MYDVDVYLTASQTTAATPRSAQFCLIEKSLLARWNVLSDWWNCSKIGGLYKTIAFSLEFEGTGAHFMLSSAMFCFRSKSYQGPREEQHEQELEQDVSAAATPEVARQLPDSTGLDPIAEPWRSWLLVLALIIVHVIMTTQSTWSSQMYIWEKANPWIICSQSQKMLLKKQRHFLLFQKYTFRKLRSRLCRFCHVYMFLSRDIVYYNPVGSISHQLSKTMTTWKQRVGLLCECTIRTYAQATHTWYKRRAHFGLCKDIFNFKYQEGNHTSSCLEELKVSLKGKLMNSVDQLCFLSKLIQFDSSSGRRGSAQLSLKFPTVQ